jgi:hypothetical protein
MGSRPSHLQGESQSIRTGVCFLVARTSKSMKDKGVLPRITGFSTLWLHCPECFYSLGHESLVTQADRSRKKYSVSPFIF